MFLRFTEMKRLLWGGELWEDCIWHKRGPLLKFTNVVFSPHNAFCTPEALESCADTVIENIESFINGRLKNIVGNQEHNTLQI